MFVFKKKTLVNIFNKKSKCLHSLHSNSYTYVLWHNMGPENFPTIERCPSREVSRYNIIFISSYYFNLITDCNYCSNNKNTIVRIVNKTICSFFFPFDFSRSIKFLNKRERIIYRYVCNADTSTRPARVC